MHPFHGSWGGPGAAPHYGSVVPSSSSIYGAPAAPGFTHTASVPLGMYSAAAHHASAPLAQPSLQPPHWHASSTSAHWHSAHPPGFPGASQAAMVPAAPFYHHQPVYSTDMPPSHHVLSHAPAWPPAHMMTGPPRPPFMGAPSVAPAPAPASHSAPPPPPPHLASVAAVLAERVRAQAAAVAAASASALDIESLPVGMMVTAVRGICAARGAVLAVAVPVAGAAAPSLVAPVPYAPLEATNILGQKPPAVEPGRLQARVADYYRRLDRLRKTLAVVEGKERGRGREGDQAHDDADADDDDAERSSRKQLGSAASFSGTAAGASPAGAAADSAASQQWPVFTRKDARQRDRDRSRSRSRSSDSGRSRSRSRSRSRGGRRDRDDADDHDSRGHRHRGGRGRRRDRRRGRDHDDTGPRTGLRYNDRYDSNGRWVGNPFYPTDWASAIARRLAAAGEK